MLASNCIIDAAQAQTDGVANSAQAQVSSSEGYLNIFLMNKLIT